MSKNENKKLCRFNARASFRVNNNKFYGMEIDTSLNELKNGSIYNMVDNKIDQNQQIPIIKQEFEKEKKKVKFESDMHTVIQDLNESLKISQHEPQHSLPPSKSKDSSIDRKDFYYYQIDEPELEENFTREEVKKKYTEAEYQFYVDEFEKIRMDYGLTSYCSTKPENANKNFYDQPCYDYNRVILQRADNKGDGYINANYVDASQKKAFICAQSPRDQTVNDFWSMVWQECSHTIVMLNKTQEIESRRISLSCSQYWPIENQTIETVDFRITNTFSITHKTYQIDVLHTEKKNSDQQSRLIYNFQFLNWHSELNFDLLKQLATDLYFFVHAVYVMQANLTHVIFKAGIWTRVPNYHPPMIVHSFDGCHRTGLFCAVYSNLIEWWRHKRIVITKRVKFLREQRYFTFPHINEYIMFIMTCTFEPFDSGKEIKLLSKSLSSNDETDITNETYNDDSINLIY